MMTERRRASLLAWLLAFCVCLVLPTQVYGDVSVSIGGDMVGSVIAETYYGMDMSTGLYVQMPFTGTVQPIASAVKGWEENGKKYQYILFGHFMQETGDDDPILWRILTVDKTNNRVLLLSENILYAHSYGPSDWKKSDVYDWLNKEFLLDAFNNIERDALVRSNSRGAIFILSKSDLLKAEYGFSKSTDADVNRIAGASSYSQDKGLLGTPYYTSTVSSENAMAAVMGGGRIQEARRNRTNVGIRPALWIDLNTAPFSLAGDGTLNSPLQVY